VELAERTGDREVAAEYLGESALREAELGETASARRYAQLALALAPGRDMQTLAALTLARTRDVQRARALSDDLNKRFPAHTLLQEYWLPLIQASLELDRGKASKAIEILEPAAAFDLAEPPPVSLTTLYLPYLRGSAYLAEGDGERAAGAVSEIPGAQKRSSPISLWERWLTLAWVVPMPRSAISRLAEPPMETFFSLWKDADPDIPILRESQSGVREAEMIYRAGHEGVELPETHKI